MPGTAHRVLRVTACWLLALPTAAAAHHSQVEFDRNTVIEVEGDVVEVIWSNPHVGLKLRAEAEDGRAVLWQMEAADLITTVRRGVPDRAGWNPDDDPALRCVSIGMPRAITRTGPHPIEFVERDGNIHILMEYFDLERVIHMGPDADPASARTSALGYSVGRWEEGDLVVETTRVGWPYFDIRDLEFVPQSEQVVILERFKLSDDEKELRLDITVSDPAAFTRPVMAQDYALWRWRPGVRVEPYNCTLEQVALP